jgi:hypothetical protein
MFRDMFEYLGYLVVLGLFILVLSIISDGPSKVAYEIGHTFASLRAGFEAGGAVGASNLNQVFPEKKQ